MDGLSSYLPSSTHQPRLMQPIASTPTKYLSFKSPPTSLTHLGLKYVHAHETYSCIFTVHVCIGMQVCMYTAFICLNIVSWYHQLIHHVTQGEKKSRSSVQHCFWLVSCHQQDIPSIYLSYTMKYKSLDSSIVVYVQSMYVCIHVCIAHNKIYKRYVTINSNVRICIYHPQAGCQ